MAEETALNLPCHVPLQGCWFGGLMSACSSEGAAVNSWRRCCLHEEEHGPDCTTCTEAPADSASTVLVGQEGLKNGAKLLKSLVCKSPEWRDVENRRKTARLAVAQCEMRVAEALATGKSANLHKEELLWLSRTWGLRSSVWRRRGAKGEPAGQAPEPAPADASEPSEPEGPLRPRTRQAAGGARAPAQLKPPAEPENSASASASASEGRIVEVSGAPQNPAAAAPGVWSSLAELAAIMDRGVSADCLDAKAILLALHNNALPRIKSVADRILNQQISAELVCGPLLSKWGDFFLTDDTLSHHDGVSLYATNMLHGVRQIVTVASFRLLEAKAAGPLVFGSEQEAQQQLVLGENDLCMEVLGRDVCRCFFDMKAKVVALRARRSSEPANPAKAAWEDLHLTVYEGQLELLSAMLLLLARARQCRQAQARDTLTLYLEVVCALGAFSCRYQADTVAAIAVRKAWLKKVLEERALREAGGPRIIDVTEAAANPPAKCAGARSGGRGAGAPGAQDGVKEAMSTFCQRMEVLMGQLPTLTA